MLKALVAWPSSRLALFQTNMVKGGERAGKRGGFVSIRRVFFVPSVESGRSNKERGGQYA